MRRYLLASTAILALAVPAHAEDITTTRNTPVQTSTVKNGSADAVKITSTGAVVLTSGTAVTMDSNNAVTNQGKVTIGNSNGAIGIRALAGTNGTIENSGTITIDEPYTATDTDNDGDLDGPFALGSNRFGIRTDGAHAGRISNTGTITIEGNDSAAIWLGGPQNGPLVNDGTIKVTGDRSVAIHAGDVTGNVRVAGTISVQGKDAVAADLTGDITGALEIQGTIVSTGYRYTTAPANTSKLDADDLLQGGSAIVVAGDVTGGIILAVPPKDNNADNKDEDGDGIEDAKEGTAKVVSFGAAPAMVIGATDHAIAIGPVASTAAKYGVQIDGSILGSGVYGGIDGNGLVIGGQGGAVTVANGIGVTGSVSATSVNASATALRLGAGASTPRLQNSGTIEAKGGAAATAKTVAVAIDQGASLNTLANSGSIKATASGEGGSATAISDASGTVKLIENSGLISATGAKADSGRNIAVDLSANTSGVTVKQTVVSGSTGPGIKGDVRLGSGNDTLDLADGTFVGDAFFGAGANTYTLSGDAAHAGMARFGAGNDSMTLSGTSVFAGQADFGGGSDMLTISGSAVFSGSVLNSSSLAVNVTGGILDLSKPSSLGSLNVASGAMLVFTLDKEAANTSLYDITGAATFASGAKLGLRITDVDNSVGSYVVLDADSITGASGLTVVTDALPYIFKASVGTPSGTNQLVVDIAKRTTQELGLNRSQSSAYDAIFAALGGDEDFEKAFLGINDGDTFRAAVRQMLPDHAGGTFEGISLGTRAFGRQVADPPSPVYSKGGLDIIMTGAAWTSEKSVGETASYNLDGLGFGLAGEVDTKLGAFGVSATWIWNEYDQGNDLTNVMSDTYELAAYWRGHWGGFTAYGRGSVGMSDMRGRRTFIGQSGGNPFQRDAIGNWNAMLFTASGGVAYEGGGRHLFFRPAVSFDYLNLDEDGYTDTGGGEGLDLIVDGRKSDELAVSGGMTLGIDFTGQRRTDRNWFRLETEGGWREVVGGALGATTAQFEDGTPFVLDPEELDGGWYARLRAIGGGSMFEMSGEVGAEDRHGHTAMTLRGTLRMGF